MFKIGTPVDKIMTIFDYLFSLESIKQESELVDDLMWAKRMIRENKVFDNDNITQYLLNSNVNKNKTQSDNK